LEGFTDKQINEMKTRKIKNLFLDALVTVFNRFFGDITFLQKSNLDLTFRFQPHLKNSEKNLRSLIQMLKRNLNAKI